MQGIVAGDRLAPVLGHGGDLYADPCFECGEPAIVDLRVLAIEGRVGGIGDGKACRDVGDVAARAGHVLPAVGVPSGGGGRRHDDARPLERGGVGQAIDPTLEAQPVADQHLSAGQNAQVVRLGLVGVGVGVGPDQDREVDLVAADLGHEVAQDREGRDDLEPFLGGNRDSEHEQEHSQQ